MTRRKNPYPGVRKNVVKGRIYWKFERGDFRTNIPGPYGSPEFLAAYEAALAGSKASSSSTALAGTLAWLIEQYLRSLRFQNLSDSRKRTIRLELDWLRKEAGKYHFERLEVRHVEALMSKKKGPTAANTVKKNLSMLFNFAAKKLSYTGPNPARHAERMKTNPDGFHTWTEAEVNRFLERHGPGTKARLVMLLALNTGMARQDLARVGRQHIKGGRIAYRRHKTAVAADMPILPELAEELRHVPKEPDAIRHSGQERQALRRRIAGKLVSGQVRRGERPRIAAWPAESRCHAPCGRWGDRMGDCFLPRTLGHDAGGGLHEKGQPGAPCGQRFCEAERGQRVQPFWRVGQEGGKSQ
ncbi:tyrosine-type recombinase/integrase [Rhodophyticola porphyridii]|uniref:tyrosine-type recombinase/integrase n=1 Tax=Rhodophyticola porphyridii TaxID=1852017 RepID=UPI0035D0B022